MIPAIKIKVNKIVFTTVSGIEERFGLIINNIPAGEYTRIQLIEKLDKLKKGCERYGTRTF